MLLVGKVAHRTLFGGTAAPLHIWITPAHYDLVIITWTSAETKGLVPFALLLQRTNQYMEGKRERRELGFYLSSMRRSPAEPCAPCLPQLGCRKPPLLSPGVV